MTGVVETKLAQKEGKVRQLQASSAAGEKRPAAPMENLPPDESGKTRVN